MSIAGRAEPRVCLASASPRRRELLTQIGEPQDKAGGYAIQGFAAAFIEAVCGSYSGVMGLPLYDTAELLRSAGVRCWCKMEP